MKMLDEGIVPAAYAYGYPEGPFRLSQFIDYGLTGRLIHQLTPPPPIASKCMPDLTSIDSINSPADSFG